MNQSLAHTRCDIGIFGGGQLGRMLAMAALPLGLHCSFFDPAGEDCPAAALGPVYTDLNTFMQSAALFTYEFENIEPSLVEQTAQHKPVLPGLNSLTTSRHRWREKELFQHLGIPAAPWYPVTERSDLSLAKLLEQQPQVLKTATSGYDGKGQALIHSTLDIENAWNSLGTETPLIAEQWVPFQRELSLIAVRSQTGETAFYPLVQNVHHKGILSHTLAPAPNVDSELQSTAETYSRRILEHMQHVGVLTLELFVVGDELLANEIAPRVHNSGHWTIEGAVCSQFENHIRAIMGWPLGSTKCKHPSIMINLIAEVPATPNLLRLPNAHVHLYGKQARPGRKLGHITLQTDPAHSVQQQLRAIGACLPNPMALNID